VGGEVKETHKELVLDTDMASFTLAFLGVVVCAGFAAIEWLSFSRLLWRPASKVQVSTTVTWQTYMALGLGGLLIFFRRRPSEFRILRFAFIALLVFLGLKVGFALLHLNSGAMLWSSFCSALIGALCFSGMAIFLIAWLWHKFREAQVRSNQKAIREGLTKTS
jgi:hypothetical protein